MIWHPSRGGGGGGEYPIAYCPGGGQVIRGPNTLRHRPQFAQLYTIHGLSGNHHISGCYALLPNKTREMYMELLQQVDQLTNGFQPQSIMTDYDQAGISAIPNVYPNTSVFRCFISPVAIDLQKGARTRSATTVSYRRSISKQHSDVPMADILQSFDGLTQHCLGYEQVTLDYFETNYIGEFRRGRRGDPRFPHNLWNIHPRVVLELSRTNDMLEGRHKTFNAFISKFGNLFRFYDTIQRVRVARFLAGNAPGDQKRVYPDVNVRLINLVNNYPNRPIIEFLSGISYNLSEPVA